MIHSWRKKNEINLFFFFGRRGSAAICISSLLNGSDLLILVNTKENNYTIKCVGQMTPSKHGVNRKIAIKWFESSTSFYMWGCGSLTYNNFLYDMKFHTLKLTYKLQNMCFILCVSVCWPFESHPRSSHCYHCYPPHGVWFLFVTARASGLEEAPNVFLK